MKGILGLFVLLLLFISCAGKPRANLDLDAAAYPQETSSALLMDEELASVIEIQNQSLSQDENGVLLAETLLLNKTNQPVTLELRSLFKNEQGVTEETSPWKKTILPPSERRIYVAPSLNRNAVRFLVQIRISTQE